MDQTGNADLQPPLDPAPPVASSSKRVKKLIIAGVAAAALAAGLLAGGALGPGVAAAQTATPDPKADSGSAGKADCPDKGASGSPASQDTVVS
ncbi:MAG: hypothetical protein ACT4OM_01280 [Actinomycetota bacterium]